MLILPIPNMTRLNIGSYLHDGLAAYYRFDGNSNDELGANDGADSAVTYTSGKVGDCAVFSGSGSQIAISAIPGLATNLTIVGWIYAGNTSGFKTIFDVGTQSQSLSINIQSGAMGMTEKNVSDYVIGGTVVQNTWHHIAVVKAGDGSNNVTGYIDGVAVGTASIGSISTPSGTAYFGARNDGSSRFVGRLDQFGIWTRALSGDDIGKIYGNRWWQYPIGMIVEI